MKKLKSYKGFVIAQANENDIKNGSSEIEIFTKDEWEMGEGCRYTEMQSGSVDEAKAFIDCY